MKPPENSMGYFALYIFFIPLMIMSMFYGGNVVDDIDLETNPEVQDVKEYNVDSNWTENGTLTSGMLTDSDIIYPDTNADGNWTSFIEDIPRSRLIELNYDADMRNGNGRIYVKAWEFQPNGTQPNETRIVELQSGLNTETLNLSEYNFFEYTIEMEETAGSMNQRPNVDALRIDYEIIEGTQAGLDSGTIQLMFWLLMLFAISGMIVGIAMSIKYYDI